MNDVEQRLRAAAEETRQLAQTRIPPKLDGSKQRQPRALLVFAAAFALVIVTFGVVPWLASNNESPDDVVAQPTATTAAPMASTVPGSETTVVGSTCSSNGTPLPGDVSGLPEAVASKRQAVIDAAAACDLEALETLAGETFVTSVTGASGFEKIREWEEQGFEEGGAIEDRQPGTGVLGKLIHLLGTSHGTVDDGERGLIYVWPAAATYDSWDDIPQEQIEELRPLYTEEDFDLLLQFGEEGDWYPGWRTGIRENGEWIYFTPGGD